MIQVANKSKFFDKNENKNTIGQNCYVFESDFWWFQGRKYLLIFAQNLELLAIVAFMHRIKAAANAMWPYWHFSSVIKSDIKAGEHH